MFDNAARLEQKTRARNQFITQSNELQARRDADLDISEDNQKKYADDLVKIRSDASDLITYPADKNSFALDTELNNTTASLNLQGSYRKKLTVATKFETDLFHSNQRDLYAKAKSSEEKQALIDGSAEQDQSMVADNMMYPAEAEINALTREQEWVQYEFNEDMAFTKEMTSEDVINKLDFVEQKILNNGYRFSSAKERSDALDVVEKSRKGAIKREKYDRELLLGNNTKKFNAEVVANPDMTVSEAYKFAEDNPMSEKVLNNFVQQIVTGKSLTQETDKEVIQGIITTFPDLDQSYTKLAEQLSVAYGKEEISQKDYNTANSALTEIFKDAKDTKASKTARNRAIKSAIGLFNDTIGTITGTDQISSVYNMTMEFLTEVGAGKLTTAKDVQDSARKIMLDQVKADNPVLGMLTDAPNMKASKGSDTAVLVDGQTNLKADRKVNLKPDIVVMTLNGEQYNIPVSRKDEYLKKGLKVVTDGE